MTIDIATICWSFFRMTFKSFAEGTFIYLLINTKADQFNVPQHFSRINKKGAVLFSFVYSFLAVFFTMALNFQDFYRLASVIFVFFYFWNKQKNINKVLVNGYSNVQDMWHALTVAMVLVLAMGSLNSISHMLFHILFVLAGAYDTIRSVDIFYQLYKSAIMLLDVFFIFWIYKLRLIKAKDLKAMSAYKLVPISFGLCLVLSAYVGYTYCIFYNVPLTDQYRETLLWILALMLPLYIGFYSIVTHLAKLLSLRANAAEDKSVLIWIFNPSIIETTHLDIYDSDVFMANFISKKLAFEKKLKKLGINDECKGYSELVFCLVLTRLFIGLKGWCFERDIFEQASLVVDTSISNLHKNIENIIEQVWFTNETQFLVDGYYLPYCGVSTYSRGQRPTVEEFLMSVAKSV